MTMAYPYDEGEKNFVLTEILHLKDFFDITIISSTNQVKSEYGKDIENLKEYGVRMYNVPYSEISKFTKIVMGIGAFCSPIVRKEIFEILRGKQVFRRIYEAIAFYIYGRKFYREVYRKKIIENSNNTILYTYWYNVQTLGSIFLKQKYPKVKIVTRAHGFDLYNERFPGNRQPYKNIMDAFIERVYFICDTGKEYYLNHFKHEMIKDKYLVARIGTKAVKCENPIKKSDKFRFVSCSSLIPLKRVNLIIEALSLIPSDLKIEWIHFGDGMCKAKLLEQAYRMLKSKKNIEYTFLGNVENGVIQDYYSKFYVDAFISVSSTEGLPVSMQEAMAYGIPLIGTDVGGVHELIKENGFLLMANPTASEICNMIMTYMILPESKIDEMRSKSVSMWKENYCSDCNSENITKSLLELVD